MDRTRLKRGIQALLLCAFAGFSKATLALDAPRASATEAAGPSAQYFAQTLAKDLAPLQVTASDANTVQVRAPNGAKTDIKIEVIRSACAQSKDDGAHCVDAWLSGAVGLLRTADIKQLRAQLAIERGITFVYKGLSDATPWHAPAFGSLRIECYKGAPEFRYPINQWDGRALNLSAVDIGHSCLENTRAALAPLNIPTQLPADGIGIIHGRFAASHVVFVDEWASIAKQFDNKLLIAIPASDTILYAARNDEAAATALSKRALALRGTMSNQYQELTIDAYRWTPTGWETATSHYMADSIAEILRQTNPHVNVAVIDAETIASGVQEPQSLSLGGLGLSCPAASPTCAQARIDFVARFIQPRSNAAASAFPTH